MLEVGGDGFDVPIAIVVGVHGARSGAPIDDVESTYALHGWEYVDAGGSGATQRVADALKTHAWPGGHDDAHDAMDELTRLERLTGAMDDGPPAWRAPPPPAALQDALEAFLADASDDDAPPADAPREAAAPAATHHRARDTGAHQRTTSDEFGAFVSGEDVAQDDEPFPAVFERLRSEVERVMAMPHGPAREREAARVALSVQQNW